MHKKGQEDDLLSGIEKSNLLQISRCFDERTLDPFQCRTIISQLIILFNRGETLTDTEKQNLFFGVTKLFQSNDQQLRRMVYLMIRELKPDESISFIAVNCLNKDINTQNELYRANAIRTLSKIIDSSMLQQIERFIKASIIDKNDAVSTAALIAGTVLFKIAPEIVKKWITEVQEKLGSQNSQVQFQALVLLLHVKKNDKVALSKLLSSLTQQGLKSSLAQCQLIRYIKKTIESGNLDNYTEKVFLDYLDSCLHKSNDMVIYEAARSLCELPQIQTRDLTPAYTVLQLFLTSNKAPIRYAALKTLNRLAQNHPKYLQSSYQDFESLINDQNRCIACMAISTLLKVSNEQNVEKMLKQITSYMTDASDDFKIDVIKSVQMFATRMPSKTKTLVQFIYKRLKEEGTYDLKKNSVQAILSIANINQESKDFAITMLVEYIEDCEYDLLLNQVLYEIGIHGPSLNNPSRFIRNIYNRIVLEKPPVRAAAVSALSKFGQLETLRTKIINLLEKCLQDQDDEVRERSAYLLQQLKQMNVLDQQSGSPTDQELKCDLPISIEQLQQALISWSLEGKEGTFKIQDICEPVQIQQQAVKPKATENKVQKEQKQEQVVQKETQNEVMPGFGKPIFTSPEIQLTEQSAEYVVTLFKHVYQDKFVLQVKVRNTMDSIQMENVYLEIISQEFQILEQQAAKKIVENGEDYIYIVLSRPQKFKAENIQAKLKFTVKEMEGEEVNDTYEDEYKLENVGFFISDCNQNI